MITARYRKRLTYNRLKRMEVNQDEKEKARYFNAIDGTIIDLVENGLYEYIGVGWILDSDEEA